MKVAVLLNARARLASHGDWAHEILAAFREAGISARVHLCDPAQLTTMARSLAGAVDVVVAAGGDGTVSSVATGLVNTGVPLGVIPLGTRNHFAKDIGIPDVPTAIKVIAEGHTRLVDIGEVNGHVFVNNSSIGLYPEMVTDRKSLKWFPVLRATLRTLLRFPLLHVAVALAGRVFSARTPFVMIGNNEYALTVRELGSRPRLDTGKLSVYTIRATRRAAMFGAMLRALFRSKKPLELEAHNVDRADIVTTKRSLRVAVDGEVYRMVPPLKYKSRPGALLVVGVKP